MKCFNVDTGSKESFKIKSNALFYFEAVDYNACVEGAKHKCVMQDEYMIITNVNRCLATGDNVFVGGCDMFFECEPPEMLKAMDFINGLPDDTKILCGQGYNRMCFEFCL